MLIYASLISGVPTVLKSLWVKKLDFERSGLGFHHKPYVLAVSPLQSSVFSSVNRGHGMYFIGLL